MSPNTWQYVTAHATGFSAIFLAIGYAIAEDWTNALQFLGVAAAAWGLNLKPMPPLPERPK